MDVGQKPYCRRDSCVAIGLQVIRVERGSITNEYQAGVLIVGGNVSVASSPIGAWDWPIQSHSLVLPKCRVREVVQRNRPGVVGSGCENASKSTAGGEQAIGVGDEGQPAESVSRIRRKSGVAGRDAVDALCAIGVVRRHRGVLQAG